LGLPGSPPLYLSLAADHLLEALRRLPDGVLPSDQEVCVCSPATDKMMAPNVTSDLLGLTSDIHAKFSLEIREMTYKWILERNVLDLILYQASHDLASYPDPPSEKDLIHS
jgi:hypothetical protein